MQESILETIFTQRRRRITSYKENYKFYYVIWKISTLYLERCIFMDISLCYTIEQRVRQTLYYSDVKLILWQFQKSCRQNFKLTLLLCNKVYSCSATLHSPSPIKYCCVAWPLPPNGINISIFMCRYLCKKCCVFLSYLTYCYM